MIWGAVSSAGVGPLCFIKSKVNAAVHQEILEHFMLPSADKLYGDADFLFQHDLGPARSAKTTANWFADHDITITKYWLNKCIYFSEVGHFCIVNPFFDWSYEIF